ncbi:hypothetical protein AAL_02741 [Moelleriella libera RCEF 2490]|uniref:Uncharacterized protein n=1 Tax=Moelleriella libera RCEF 2490 TaxID=1081109 RepID=A0A166PUR7_9HYPO|nr:hypothetical protein AAL_02741 [Moelleriella libera RCEF 2490]
MPSKSLQAECGSAPQEPQRNVQTGGQARLRDERLAAYFEQDPYSAPRDAAARRENISRELDKAAAAFKRS